MSADAIYNVTNALAARLRRAIATLDGPVEGEVIVGPLDAPRAREARLILFLYRMVPARDLRNTEHRVPKPGSDNEATVHEKALPLDLHYIVTTGASDNDIHGTLLRPLGHAIRELNDNPYLIGDETDQAIVRVTMEPLSTEEISRIWALFPTVDYRTSVAYVVSPVWIDPAEVGPRDEPAFSTSAPSGART